MEWTEECGYPLVHGGPLPPYTVQLAGGAFSIAPGSSTLSADLDVSASLQEGDRFMLDGALHTVSAPSVWTPPSGGQVRVLLASMLTPIHCGCVVNERVPVQGVDV